MSKFKILTALIALSFFYACGNKQTSAPGTSGEAPGTKTETSTTDYDPKRGVGNFNESNLTLDAALNVPMAEAGEKASGVKCTSCHKLTEGRLVGPGWKGVTQRRTPSWIMNFITNPEPMIDKDPELQAQLELCLVRMPNQSLTEEDARNILEFMRKNDGVK
ncbi:MAG: c-type cytochrome [Saprospiraceae bacterium]|nr:c-type cytochrome [Saprospiraceae bacterium]